MHIYVEYKNSRKYVSNYSLQMAIPIVDIYQIYIQYKKQKKGKNGFSEIDSTARKINSSKNRILLARITPV